MTPDHRVTFALPDGAELEAPGYGRLNLLAHAEMVELELLQRCGGRAECGTCRVRILEGEVSAPARDEAALMARQGRRFAQGERLACRAKPRGDVIIEVLALIPR